MIKRTRMTPRGYTRARYVCFDCGRETASTLKVYRGTHGRPPRLADVTLVCRNGTGCHKGMSASEVYAHPSNNK